jgi:hypothetical protein
VTLTLKVQDADVARVPPESETLPLPATAVMVPPPHEPVSPFGVAIVRPDGNASVKPIPVRAVDAFGLVMVKLKLVLPPAGMLAAPKDFAIEGADPMTSVAEAVLPVPAFDELIAPVTLL